LPKLIAWLFVPCACRIMKKMKPPMSSTGSSAVMSRVRMLPAALGSRTVKFSQAALPSPAAAQMCSQGSVSSDGAIAVASPRDGSVNVTVSRWPSLVTDSMAPLRASWMRSP
jgi:hypothetical protein